MQERSDIEGISTMTNRCGNCNNLISNHLKSQALECLQELSKKSEQVQKILLEIMDMTTKEAIQHSKAKDEIDKKLTKLLSEIQP